MFNDTPLTLILFVTLLTFSTLKCVTSTIPNKNDTSIVIIGAGPSGIAAASKLIQNGFHNIKIYEAETRIGGRINSVKFGDAYVDLGAEWCHGMGKDHIVYQLAKDYDILKNTEFNISIAYSSHAVPNSLESDLKNLADYLVETRDVFNVSFRDMSLKTYINNKFQEEIFDKYKNSNSETVDIVNDSIYWLEDQMRGYESAFDLSEVSVYTRYKEAEISVNLNWNGLGYHTILKILMKKYPDPSKDLHIEELIQLNSTVEKIDYDGHEDDKVLFKLKNVENTLKADHVIFTPSIGVLKHDYKTLFNPKLSDEKVKAIKNIGIGAVMKIVLHFPEIWWNDGESSFFWMWSKEDKEKLLNEFPNAPINENGNHWLTNMEVATVAENNPKVLICWLVGPSVAKVEKLPDKEIIDAVIYTFNKIYGNKYNITQPDAMIHSNWYNNPHFRGTWSFDTVKGVESDDDLHKILQQPLDFNKNNSKNKKGNFVPRLLFAGEATNEDCFSTVHGAIDSGFREAERLINLYSN